MFDHFGRRLQRDLKHIVDTRIMTSETMSGGLMRASLPIPFYRCHFTDAVMVTCRVRE
jgi:hypothetical protein